MNGQRRLIGAVATFAAPVTSFPATRSGAMAILTGNGAFLRTLGRGTRGSYYESLGRAA
jgi:hypothetical protein